MSLVDQPLPARKAGHAIDITNTLTLDDKDDFPLSSQPAAFDEPIFDKFYDMDTQDTVGPSPKRVRSSDNVPELPPRSGLRVSKMLDNLGMKLGGAVEATGLGQATTPHDVYLSSEEDVSSDADDFSDYDYDSSVEDPTSPTSRSSHEDTARVVSVVFAGKPSIVDLPAARKRPVSSTSLGTTRTRCSTESSALTKPQTAASATTEDRPITPASTASSRYSQSRPSKNTTPNRRSSILLSEILIKKKPPFLSIDPYANGSSYSLNMPKALDSLEGESQTAKTPRTPTALLKGVTRSLSLVRKRSRPALSPGPQTSMPKLDALSSNRSSVQSPPPPPPATVVHGDEGGPEPDTAKHEQQPKTPMTPITYTDILRAVKRNATVMGGAPSPPSDIMSPTSPGPAAAATAATKRGILGGLAARRRSVKLTGKV
ncbi:hypothetical protein N657DRAFT_631433 [Parathielavia appendiculata]|uniref:Uncharacterized protein n=1 Tax=Parathielavia appendiculata TaxID=2587402 RepID=A0AAN6U725_9PEZI|nr:hypothetical protein N657DRAFT_631433 [Parathielavia appendiculata]